MEKPILSIRNLQVDFIARGKTLTAIRNVSLDIYKSRVLAIVGESGSGKSVLTKTFTGMLEDNGRLTKGRIYLDDPELKQRLVFGNADIIAKLQEKIVNLRKAIFENSRKRNPQITFYQNELKQAIKELKEAQRASRVQKLQQKKVSKESAIKAKLEFAKIKETLKQEGVEAIKIENTNYLTEKQNILVLPDSNEHKRALLRELVGKHTQALTDIEAQTKAKIFHASKVCHEKARGQVRVGYKKLPKLKLKDNYSEYNSSITAEEAAEFADYVPLHKFVTHKDWQNIRGKKIATIFQDPMTSLNPLLKIGYQVSEVLRLHHHMTRAEAKKAAINLLEKVGIKNAKGRYNDYPFQYSGGMRQRVVIAIALACRPDILICDEPTTALDVTIQAQIIELIKSLQQEYGFATIYITHDLGVVANVADDVAVMYSGQIVEYGTVQEIFYESKHPYTWALLSSLPQLGVKGEELFSIPGTPPSLFTKIKGDAFAPRNPFALAIDKEYEPPFFQITATHKAKTWLLDPRAPKVEPPDSVKQIRERLAKIAADLARLTGE